MDSRVSVGSADAIGIESLPDDVFFKIFSFMPLRSVLRLEHICQRLHQSISSYLHTLQSLHLYHQPIKRDIFRHYNPCLVPISPDTISALLKRCPLVRCIKYLVFPYQAMSLDADICREMMSAIEGHGRKIQIEFMDNRELLKKLLEENDRDTDNIVFTEVSISTGENNSISVLPSASSLSFDFTRTVHLEEISLNSKALRYFSKYLDISLIRCILTADSQTDLSDVSFPNLRKYIYVEQAGKSASARVGAQLLRKAVQCGHLKILRLGLSEFSALETAALSWKATELEDLEVASTGSYSASLQQLRYASVIADICHQCRLSLRRVSLPSSILIKRFFTQLVSRGCVYQSLHALQMTGIADTKMFLAPGNMVETQFYREFLKLCPAITSLSLHSFTGSLSSLMLPLSLTELVLPWDNRLHLARQKSEVLVCLSTLPQLKNLSIFGVEEVDSLLAKSSTHRNREPPDLEISIESLKEFRIKNICIKSLTLKDCTSLVGFTLQCCPTLTTLSLPSESLEKVHIYDDYRSYIKEFVKDFVSVKKRQEKTKNIMPCHIHIQIHSVVDKEPDLKMEYQKKADDLILALEKTCKDSIDSLDFFIVRDESLHIFDHNSGESLYPFTDIHSQSFLLPTGRSKTNMDLEISRRRRILEGLKRWTKCIAGIKSLACVSVPVTSSVLGSPLRRFETCYCSSNFVCATNLLYLLDINSSPNLCQPSGIRKCNSRTNVTPGSSPDTVGNTSGSSLGNRGDIRGSSPGPSDTTAGGSPGNGDITPGGFPEEKPAIVQSIMSQDDSWISDLNVPCIESSSEPCFSSQWNVNTNPLILVSIIEYVHNIHTLFYYD